MIRSAAMGKPFPTCQPPSRRVHPCGGRRIASIPRAPLLGLALLGLVGCGGDEASTRTDGELPPSRGEAPGVADDPAVGTGEGDGAGASPPPPAAAGAPRNESATEALEARLATGYVDPDNRESWVCRGAAFEAEYLLIIDAGGRRHGQELDPERVTSPEPFGWAAISADAVLLDYRARGRQLELSAIVFGGPHAFRAQSATSGPIDCRRQRYVDGAPTRDVPLDAASGGDPESEAARALAARIETRYASEDDFDHWFCAGDGAPVRFLFTAAGVLDAVPRALELRGGAATPETRLWRWRAMDGETIVLMPLDAVVGADEAGARPSTIGSIVFPTDDAFVATRDAAVALQCLLRSSLP